MGRGVAHCSEPASFTRPCKTNARAVTSPFITATSLVAVRLRDSCPSSTLLCNTTSPSRHCNPHRPVSPPTLSVHPTPAPTFPNSVPRNILPFRALVIAVSPAIIHARRPTPIRDPDLRPCLRASSCAQQLSALASEHFLSPSPPAKTTTQL